jgi:hypothetical protein
MATAWVTQYNNIAVINNVPIQAPIGPPLRTEKVTFTGTAGGSAAIGADCHLVGIYVDTAACWKAADAPSATTSDTPISAGVPFYLVPTGLHAFSFITQA